MLAVPEHGFAQGAALTLAWDANPEPDTRGYIVYVGTSPRSYTETYDVGAETTFSYVPARPGESYYFAVVAYGDDGQFSRLSSEVSAMAPAPTVVRTGRAGASGGVVGSPRASGLVDARYAGFVAIRDDASLWRVAEDLSFSDALLASRPGIHLTGVVADPSFDQTGFLYVGEAETVRGIRTMSIARYRLVGVTLGQRAVVISGLTVPENTSAPFAIDARGHIFIALPALTRVGGSDPYSAKVLRFNADGSVPRDNAAASPVFAEGFANPTALIVDAGGTRLWMTGSGAPWHGSVASLDLVNDAVPWTGLRLRPEVTPFTVPGVVTALAVAGPSGPAAPVGIWLTAGNVFGRLLVDARQPAGFTFLPVATGSVPTSMTIRGATAYVTTAGATAARSFALPELQ